MSSDEQYTATGPAEVGFQTDGANIALGAAVTGTRLGLRGRGPIGVRGEGQIGVLGEGQGGPGGKFASDNVLAAQINVSPHQMADVVADVNAQPKEFVRLTSLPIWGTEGDLFLGRYAHIPSAGAQTTRCALWICVHSSVPAPPANPALPPANPALWSQVLLGNPVDGQAVIHTL